MGHTSCCQPARNWRHLIGELAGPIDQHNDVRRSGGATAGWQKRKCERCSPREKRSDENPKFENKGAKMAIIQHLSETHENKTERTIRETAQKTRTRPEKTEKGGFLRRLTERRPHSTATAIELLIVRSVEGVRISQFVWLIIPQDSRARTHIFVRELCSSRGTSL